YVSRIPKGAANGDHAFVLAVVVSGSVTPEVDRGIQYRVIRTKTVIDGRRINERLERRTGLPHRLSRTIEFAVVEIVSADHGLDFAGLRLDCKERALDLRLLLEDRKSTRLNSSHVASSYAVFCLKKKNGVLS